MLQYFQKYLGQIVILDYQIKSKLGEKKMLQYFQKYLGQMVILDYQNKLKLGEKKMLQYFQKIFSQGHEISSKSTIIITSYSKILINIIESL
jgi:hypothetical protein